MFQYQSNINLDEIGSHGVLPTFSGATQIPNFGTRIGNNSQRVDRQRGIKVNARFVLFLGIERGLFNMKL